MDITDNSFLGHAYLHNLKNSLWATYDRGSDANSVDVQPYVTYSNSTNNEEGRQKRSPEQSRQMSEYQVKFFKILEKLFEYDWYRDLN